LKGETLKAFWREGSILVVGPLMRPKEAADSGDIQNTRC
jgi:hypothetical protein